MLFLGIFPSFGNVQGKKLPLLSFGGKRVSTILKIG